MSDVDAIRYLASEHDLEFVDLDNYKVDDSAADILPEAVARRHHVVAVKRKFGTPVIAIANPDDVFALDTLRASVGRDFISVVASREQIAAVLDRFYGPSAEAPAAEPVPVAETVLAAEAVLAAEPLAPPEAPLPDLPPPPAAEADSEAEAEELPAVGDDTLGLSLYGSAFLPSESAVVEEGAPEPGPAGLETSEFEALPEVPTTNGNGVHAEAEPVTDAVEESVDSAPDSGEVPAEEEPAWQDLMEDPVPAVVDEPVAEEPVPEVETLAEPPPPPPVAEVVDEADPLTLSSSLPPLATSGPDLQGFDGSPAVPDLGPASEMLTASADELAEFARAVQIPLLGDGVDSASATADLVDEAVAHYEEQHLDDVTAAGLASAMPPLAKALVEGGRVSLEDMESVIAEHDAGGQSIARILTSRKLVDEADLMWGMAQEMGLEFIDLDTAGVHYTAGNLIPEATARHHNVLVIAEDDGTPVVAASNPTDVFAMDDLRTIIGRNFVTVVATRSQISAYIGQVYHGGGDASDMAKTASLEFDRESDAAIDDISAVTEEAPIVRYVNLLVVQALNERASDIHVEPTEGDLRIRYRIDGVLHDVSTAPRSIAQAVTTRLKVMADMNIAEHRIPQDGRISLNVGNKGVDLRMATLPTIHGEKVVMRVLDKSSVVLGFPDLGFDADLLETYENIFTKPYGTILVTGPTGSGKSTTLYTTLTALNSPEKNIITVEDPVELRLQGINQVQLNLKAGLTFASALKSILRSDPDIVLVGEIRDKETAVIAIEAALTGHLVLATVHTNSAASTPMRLVEMGLEPFLVTSSISGVVAQRLARRLCVHCKEPYDMSRDDIIGSGWNEDELQDYRDDATFYRAIGCTACSNTGYRGRKALAELMPMTEEIDRLIIEGGSVDDIHRLAVEQGMVTLRRSGLRKAMEGETTLEEVLRVVA
jgi:type IV pilus assembly protein PilB